MTFATIIVSLLLFSANTAGPKEEATKNLIIERASALIEAQFNADQFRFSLQPRWMPNSMLQAGPENIKSVEISGEVSRYTKFRVRYFNINRIDEAEIQVHIEAEQKAPVAAKRIRNGEAITPDMILNQWVEITLGRDQLVEDEETLIGNTVRRTINPGQPIRSHEITSPLVVNPGEVVVMEFSKTGISIALQCEARQAGAINEEVHIYCAETRKKYLAEVTGIGEVSWLKTY